ncbi:MAG: hypothetical protein QXW97_02385 [Candidatus Pacearchaeota archaeon]
MRKFYIPHLIPLEDCPRDYSLRFLTQVWRNFNNFSYLLNKPFVREINGEFYLEDGNHRSVWLMINDIYFIDADFEIPDKAGIIATLRTVDSVRERGVHNINDLVMKVKNPSQYLADGPITHKISLEDLKNPKYFLRI